MEDKEIRFVHREETFNDLAVRELADSRSACICRLQFGRCNEKECASCDIFKQYSDCYNQMNEYDRQRLAKYVSEKYCKDSLFPEKWMCHSRLVKRVVSYCIFCFVLIPLLFGLLFFFGSQPGDIPNKYSRVTPNEVIPYTYDPLIRYTLNSVIKNIYDVNGDDIINCIDYTLMFKVKWDNFYPDKRHQIIILRNYNVKTGFHHLYIALIDDNYNVYYIEPYTSDPSYYRTIDLWTDKKIDHSCDIWDETNYWLGRIK